MRFAVRPDRDLGFLPIQRGTPRPEGVTSRPSTTGERPFSSPINLPGSLRKRQVAGPCPRLHNCRLLCMCPAASHRTGLAPAPLLRLCGMADEDMTGRPKHGGPWLTRRPLRLRSGRRGPAQDETRLVQCFRVAPLPDSDATCTRPLSGHFRCRTPLHLHAPTQVGRRSRWTPTSSRSPLMTP